MDRQRFRDLQKTMTFREKVSYLWHYYKIHMIAVVFIAAFSIYVINGTVNSKELALNVVFMGEHADIEQLKQLEEEFDKELISEQDARVSLQFINSSTDKTDQKSLAYGQKFAAQLAAGTIDVLITDKQMFEMMKQEGNAMDLSEFIDVETIDEEELELVRSDSGKVIGIRTSGMEKLDTVIPEGEKILYVPANAEHINNIGKLIQLLTSP